MKKIIALLLLLVLFTTQLFTIQVSAYSNPMILEREWPNYSIGDPFILKYNGNYYLYVSTKDGQTGVKCWQSQNLVDWTYVGLCSTDPITTTAYAPEVLYYNGYFYMYTSPAGGGHYILRSDSPTGPFEVVTGNLGKSIDGSAFVDDDGTIYFLHAAVGLLGGCQLTTPSQIAAGTDFSIPVSVNGAWTEGPTLFKRNNRYYLTYTGNHVIHDSYRVEYATSISPISGYTEPEQNLLLLSADGFNRGFGHNSIVIGPDLDTYYIVYHSLESPNGPLRHMNLDRILWNGDKLCVQATAGVETENPALPDYQEYFSDAEGWKTIDSLWLTETATAAVYTAEYNWKLEDASGTFNVYFSYTDAQNYGKLTVDADNSTLTLELVANGTVQTTESVSLMQRFNFKKLHTFTIRQTADTLTIQLDQQQKFSLAHKSTGGSIGYDTDTATLYASYTAFSNKAMGSHDFDTLKNFPSTIEAIHANAASPHSVKVEASAGDNSFAYQLGKGGWLDFSLSIPETDTYSLSIAGLLPQGDTATVRLILDEEIMWDNITLTPQTEDGYSTWVIRGLELPEGNHTLRLAVQEGSLEAYEISGALESDMEEISGDIGSQDFTFYDEGNIRVRDTSLVFGTSGSFAKALLGDTTWTDYTVETTVTLRSGGNAGLLIRAKNATDGLADNLGIHSSYYHQGYYVCLTEGSVNLFKHNYDSTLLHRERWNIEAKQEYRLTVKAEGSTITILVDDQEVFTYTDTEQPYLTGKVGMKTEEANADFTSFSVTALSADALIPVQEAYDHVNIPEQPAPANQGNFLWIIWVSAGIVLLLLAGGIGYWLFRRNKSRRSQ